MNSPGESVPNMLIKRSGEIAPERMKRWSQIKKKRSVVDVTVMEVKFDAVKNSIA